MASNVLLSTKTTTKYILFSPKKNSKSNEYEKITIANEMYGVFATTQFFSRRSVKKQCQTDVATQCIEQSIRFNNVHRIPRISFEMKSDIKYTLALSF